MHLFWLTLTLLLLTSLFIFTVLVSQSGITWRQSPISLVSLTSVIVIISIGLYFKLGASQELAQHYLTQSSTYQKARVELETSPDAMIARLREAIRHSKDPAKGWELLGRLYMSRQEFNQSSDAFQQAYKLQPENELYLTKYLQAAFLSRNGKLPSNLNTIAKRLSAKNNPIALNLLAKEAYDQKNYRLAIQYWKRLLLVLPSNSIQSQELLQIIAQTQKSLVR